MTLKNEELQEQTKRLRFKNVNQTYSADLGDRPPKEIRNIGKNIKLMTYFGYKNIQYFPIESKNFSDGDKRASLFTFLHVELTRGYLLEHDEERFSARREKVYSFIKIPQELEKFMVYGFFQCADSLLFIYTFLPLRFIMAFWSCLERLLRRCFG